MKNIEEPETNYRQNLPKVTVVILNWNSLNDTLQCLKSLFESDYPNFDVIVIDNGSLYDIVDNIKPAYPEIAYIRNANNLGYTGGNNQGIKYALSGDSKYIWLLNNDTLFPPDTLRSLVDRCEKDNQLGIISPAIASYEKPETDIYYGTYLDIEFQIRKNAKSYDGILEWERNSPHRICLWGTALLLNRQLIEKIGLLDTRFYAYYEDMDYSLRSIQAGFKNILHAPVKIFHKTKAIDRADYPEYYHFYMARNEYLLNKKHLSRRKFIKFIRNYVARIIRKSASYQEKNANNSSRACLDGLWCAFFDKYGKRRENDRMPFWLVNLILWHPYFLSDLIAPRKTTSMSKHGR